MCPGPLKVSGVFAPLTLARGQPTYVALLVFVFLQACTLPLSFLLSPPEKTYHANSFRIGVKAKTSSRKQLR